eukprot:3838545-Prymnesium_polylepis.1
MFHVDRSTSPAIRHPPSVLGHPPVVVPLRPRRLQNLPLRVPVVPRRPGEMRLLAVIAGRDPAPNQVRQVLERVAALVEAILTVWSHAAATAIGDEVVVRRLPGAASMAPHVLPRYCKIVAAVHRHCGARANDDVLKAKPARHAQPALSNLLAPAIGAPAHLSPRVESSIERKVANSSGVERINRKVTQQVRKAGTDASELLAEVGRTSGVGLHEDRPVRQRGFVVVEHESQVDTTLVCRVRHVSWRTAVDPLIERCHAVRLTVGRASPRWQALVPIPEHSGHHDHTSRPAAVDFAP